MIHISQGFYRFRFIIFIFFILFFSFFLTNPWYLVGNAKCMLYCEQPTVWLARRRLNTMLLTNFENLNSIVNIFVTGERPSSDLKVIKIWFGPNIKYVSEPFFADFCCRQGITCLWQITSIFSLTYIFHVFMLHNCAELTISKKLDSVWHLKLYINKSVKSEFKLEAIYLPFHQIRTLPWGFPWNY